MPEFGRLRRPLAASVLALATLGAVGAAIAQPAADVVHARQQHFKDQGRAFKALLDQLHTGSPDPGQVKAAAHTLGALAPQLPSWFPAGSGPSSGVKTGAKAEIWTDPTGFAAAARNYQDQVDSLQAAADSGDMAAVGAQAQKTGAACGACHNKYRLKES
jgi:cytochrome c556